MPTGSGTAEFRDASTRSHHDAARGAKRLGELTAAALTHYFRKNLFLFRDTLIKLILSPNLEYKDTSEVGDAA